MSHPGLSLSPGDFPTRCDYIAMGPTITTDLQLCQNHGHHLVTIVCSLTYGLDFTADLFSASMFIRSNGHFRRALLAAPHVVNNLVIECPLATNSHHSIQCVGLPGLRHILNFGLVGGAER